LPARLHRSKDLLQFTALGEDRLSRFMGITILQELENLLVPFEGIKILWKPEGKPYNSRCDCIDVAKLRPWNLAKEFSGHYTSSKLSCFHAPSEKFHELLFVRMH
jgi:hypothetical protein